MQKSLPWLLCALLAAGLCFSVLAYGNARNREGIQETLKIRANTDNAALIESAKTMADAFRQTQVSLQDLTKLEDRTPVVNPGIDFSLKRMCQQRQASGVPCPDSKPAQPALHR